MKKDRNSESPAPPSERPSGRGGKLRWLGLGALLTTFVVGWEYLLQTFLNPQVDWNPTGIAAHMGIDVVLLAPVVALALTLGLALARRMDLSRRDAAGLLGTAGAVALAFALLATPLTAVRDLPHEWVGNTYDLSLAEVQTTVVRSDLTIQEETQLCSFGSVRDPSLARDGYQDAGTALLLRARTAAGDVLVQLAAVVPLLLPGLLLVSRRRLERTSAAPVVELFRWSVRPARLGAVAGLGVLAVVCFGGVDDSVASQSLDMAADPANACTDGGEVVSYDVSAIDVRITLNRWGDYFEGHMYALDANIPKIRQFEDDLDADRAKPEVLGDPDAVSRVAFGLRKDPIQPLVLRANLGQCLQVNFTNDLGDGEPASLHILGLPHTVDSAGGSVGLNPDTFADPGETITYNIPIPSDPNAERAYYFHDHGASRQRQSLGLFGAIVAEPEGARYLDPETGEELDTVTGSNWEAIIIDPNLDGSRDGKSFREFVIFYHEVGNEAFTDVFDAQDKKLPLVDELAGVYRPAARALSYRSEPFRRRLEVRKTAKSLGYASYPFGDPATPMPRSYVGEGTKTRLLHGGSEVFHVHHLHGGADRWRRNPNADPNNEFWKGLTKVPDPNLESIHLDSQSIGPGTSYNLEHECGAGGCQQSVGDFLYHCHIGHHYIAGMWSFWRVFGTVQTAETNMNGHPLATVPELFQNPDNPLIPPSEPEQGVSAGDLIGLTVDDGRTVVADANVTDPSTQIGVLEWIEQMLPPRGQKLDILDATVWDWTFTGSGSTLQIWGEPESDEPFSGYVSATPGERPEVLFNPKNGRYEWPLFRPQKGERPPFTARHSGAPWLGEEMKEGRLDGLCARNGVAPSVDVGPAVNRFYPLSAITLPIGVTEDRQDPDGMIFVLNENEKAVRQGTKPAEPLAIRSNVGDCVELVFTNKIPDGPLNGDFSKVNIHSHFVQFDPQASDGVITGMSYEQSVRPIESENRFLIDTAQKNTTTLHVSNTDRLRPGIWIGVGLGEATCGRDSQTHQPLPCTEVHKIASIPDANTIELANPLRITHHGGEAVGVEFVRYRWYSDVDTGTVFFHDHVEFKNWDHGLFGAHIVEPKGSTYHDPRSGDPVRSGTLVDVRVDPDAGGNPVAWNTDGSFREFVMFLHSNNPVEGRFARGGGAINLRAEPFRLRPGNPAYRFSSVTHDDPHTQEIRAYVGDPVVVRGMGLVETVGGVRFTGHRFTQERFAEQSDTRDGMFIGISERFDVSLEGGAGGTGGFPGDYLYYSTLGRHFESGAWGLLRVFDDKKGDLQPLPGHPAPKSSHPFPQLSFTGSAPPSLGDGPGEACPAGAPVREYDVAISETSIVYNDLLTGDHRGVVFHLEGEGGPEARTPLVLRVNDGECLRVNLRNTRNVRSSLNVGELIADPQRSYGAAIGLNHDSTVAAGATRTYEYFADSELGVVIGLNLADTTAIERGAFAGVVVEPAGATYSRPGQTSPLPGGGAGVQADVHVGDQTTREFVALFNDQDKRIGASAMPYPVDVDKFNGLNYAAASLALRDKAHDPSRVFDSTLWGDPRWVVTVPQGTPTTVRVAAPWGDQAHVASVEGHRWPLEPRWSGSEQVFNDVLVPGMSYSMNLIGGAGGDIQAAGDYLVFDRRQPFLEEGLWAILRSTDDGTAVSADRVAITELEESGGTSVLRGRLGPRPAGDFAPTVEVRGGAAVDGKCTGPVIGRSAVEPGSGAWQIQARSLPKDVCVTSPVGGGVLSAPLTELPLAEASEK